MPSQAFAAVQRTTYIVQTTAAGQDSVLRQLFGMGEVPLDQLDLVMDGFTVPLTEFEAAVLAADPDVISIQADQKMSLLDIQTPTPSWGLDRIDQQTNVLDTAYNYPANPGKGVRVYIVDTGVMASNPDFDGRILTGFDALGQNLQGNDCHGHGTHVAGTVAGTRFGLAKQATIVPVRVLDCTGAGYTSNILTALDWIIANNPVGTPAVMNMSIGGPAQPLFNAGIKKLYDAGILPVVAAGNWNADACRYSPAGTPEALTVGASDPNDTRASFSNYGDCVDVFAPGTNIVSDSATAPAGSAAMSGTSMATPHVVGLAALYLAQHVAAKPAEVAAAIRSNGIANAINNAQSQFGNILINDNFVRGAAPVAPNPNPVLNAPDPVASFSLTSIAGNSASFTWVDGASDGGSPVTGHILRALAAGTTIAKAINVIGGSVTTATFSGLDANTSYTFSVYPYNAIGSGKLSTGIVARTTIGLPNAPSSLTVAPSSTTASLAWALTNDGGSPITGYNVELYTSANPRWTAVGTSLNRSFTLTGLLPSVSYIARVRSVTALGSSMSATAISFTTVAGKPDVPTGVTVSNVTSTTANLAWNVVPTTTPGATVTYVVTYTLDGTTTPILVPTANPNLQLTGLAPGRKYVASVHSQIGEVVSGESALVTFATLAVAPQAPVGVVISGTAPAQTLRWSPADNGGSPITGYIVQASAPLTSSVAPVDSWSTFTQTVATTIALPTAPVGKYVRYRVIAVNAVGLSAPSLSVAIFSAPNRPSAPLGLAASAPAANGLITLTWQPPAIDGGAQILGYTVFVNRDGKTWVAIANVTVPATTFVTPQPTKGQTWSYAVSARNMAGSGTNSDSISLTTAATLPGSPNAAAVLSGTADVTVRWSAPFDNGGSTITGYLVERLVDGVWGSPATVAATTLIYVIPRPGPGVTSSFRVSAINAVGTSLPSNVAIVTTPYLQASAPQDFAAAYNATAKRVDVTFTPPTNLGGGAIRYYLVQISKDGGASWTSLTTLAPNLTASSVQAPAKGQTFGYRLLAYTQFGLGLPSNAATVSVATTAPSTPSATALGLTGASDVTFRWATPSDNGGTPITGYLLEQQVAGVWQSPIALSATANSYVVPRPASGIYTIFRISAVNAVGTSPVSSVYSVMSPYFQASAPQSFTAVYNAAGNRIDYTLTAPSVLGGGQVSRYSLQISRDAGATWVNYATLVNPSGSFGTIGKGTTASYRIMAVTQFGYGLSSAGVAIAIPTTVSSAPYANGYLVNSDGSITIRWNAPSDQGGTPVTGYKLQKQIGVDWAPAQALPAAVTSVAIPRDLPGTRSSYRVIAVNAVGDSIASSAITYVIPYLQATAVQGVSVVSLSTSTVTSTGVKVSFIDAASYGGSTPSYFLIAVSRDGGLTWLNVASTRTLTLSLAGPAKGVTWQFKVAAQTAYGLGQFSSPVSYTGQ